MNKNIIITACNQEYYLSCLTMISSVHRTSLDCVDKIIVYDLGLTEDAITFLNSLHLVQVEDLAQYKDQFYEGFFEPKQYAYKCFCHVNARKFGNSSNIFWLDSGALLTQSCKEIFDKIEDDHIFCVQDRDPHTNRRWTHDVAKNILLATDEELDSVQLCAGIFGHKANGKFSKMVDEAFRYAQIKECVQGSHETHRHDQSILSILTYRFKAPRSSMSRYGEWVNYDTAKDSKDVVVFVHRRGVHNVNGLKFRD